MLDYNLVTINNRNNQYNAIIKNRFFCSGFKTCFDIFKWTYHFWKHRVQRDVQNSVYLKVNCWFHYRWDRVFSNVVDEKNSAKEYNTITFVFKFVFIIAIPSVRTVFYWRRVKVPLNFLNTWEYLRGHSPGNSVSYQQTQLVCCSLWISVYNETCLRLTWNSYLALFFQLDCTLWRTLFDLTYVHYLKKTRYFRRKLLIYTVTKTLHNSPLSTIYNEHHSRNY